MKKLLLASLLLLTPLSAVAAVVPPEVPSDCAARLRSFSYRPAEGALQGFASPTLDVWVAEGLDPQKRAWVIAHECAHIHDYTHSGTPRAGASNFKDRKWPVWKDRAALSFFQISWTDDRTRKSDQGFVTEFARANPYEDYAESRSMFQLKRDEFAARAKKDPVLRQKFQWMKEHLERE